MYYEKANNLNGYNLRVSSDTGSQSNYTTVNYHKCGKGQLGIMCTVLNHMNAEVITKHYPKRGYINEKGEPHGLMKDVLSGIIDITMSSYFLRGFWKEQTYPSQTTPVTIVSLENSDKYFELATHIFTLRTWLFFGISSVVCVIILKYILEDSVSLAALEFGRMLVSASTLKEPSKLSGKILLITLIIATFTISTFLLSCLSAITTVLDRSPNIDSVEDLINSNVSIYGKASLKDIIWYEEIRHHYHEVSQFEECMNIVFKRNRVACISGTGSLISYFSHKNSMIHISKNNLLSRASAQVVSKDSPLLYPFTSTLLRMAEGGFIDLLRTRDERSLLKNPRHIDGFRASNIKDLTTSFTILIGGLALATIVLSFEMIIHAMERLSPRISKKVQFLKQLKKYA